METNKFTGLIRFINILNLNNSNFVFEDKCFLCYIDLKKRNRSIEHVFPKWLLNKYNLFSGKLSISNNSTIQYRQLTIPCCKDCNNTFLSQIEIEIKKLIDQKFKSINRNSQIRIAQWSAKLILGTLILETKLRSDITTKNEKNIMHKDWLKYHDNLYAILQTSRQKHEFQGVLPWSIFPISFETDKFNYLVNITYKTLGIQFGRTGFIIIFEDSNKIKSIWKNKELLKKQGNKLKLRKLNEYEFRFTMTKIMYTKSMTKGLSQTYTKFDKQKNKILIITKEPDSVEIIWDGKKDMKLRNELYKLTWPSTFLEERKELWKKLESLEIK